MKNSVELLERKQALKDEALALVAKAETEIRNLNDEENSRYAAIKAEIETINAELRALDVELPKETKQNLNNLNHNKMEKNFSLLRAIKNVAENRQLDDVINAVIERGQQNFAASKVEYTGQIQLPIASDERAISVATEGGDVVATNLFDIVKPLHSKNVLVAAGAKFITGVKGNIQFPVMSEGACTWQSENGAASDAGIAFSNVAFAPKRLTTQVSISKMLLAQDSVGVENAIREEIVNAINSKLESTILGSAAGTANMPAGLCYPGSGSGAALTAVSNFGGILDIEAGIEAANVYGDCKYIVSPKAKAKLRAMTKTSGVMAYESGELDGTPVMSTTNVCKATSNNTNGVYGDWSQFGIVTWDGIDITVDTVTRAAYGEVKLVINFYVDAKPIRATAFKAFHIN